MAVVTGSQGVDATPAVTIYNILATALAANANWTLVDTLTAANAGTTADCKVWKCTGGISDFFVCFENDDANARIRVRAAENYETGGAAADRLRQPVGGGTAATTTDASSVTPTANDTVTDSDITWGTTNPHVWYVQVNTAAAGFTYLHKVEDDKFTFATRSGSANSFVVVGEFVPLGTAITELHPLILMSHAYTGIAWTPTAAAQRCAGFSRTPGVGAVAQTGAFAGGVAPLHFPPFAGSIFPANSDSAGPHNSSVNHRYYTNQTFVSTAIVHGAQAGAIAARTSFRGYLPDFVGARSAATPVEPPVGDTITIDGTVYYWLGCSFGQGTALVDSDPLLAVKA